MDNFIVLEEQLEDILEKDIRNVFPEECGLTGAIDIPNASTIVQDGMLLQEPRGEKSAGIISCEGYEFHHRLRMGKPTVEFGNYDARSNLPGAMAISHNRYATAGSAFEDRNIQPLLVMKSKFGKFALGHNGTLAGVGPLEQELLEDGVAFQSTTDSELLTKLICRENESKIENAIAGACRQIDAAYSLLIMTEDALYAVRDRHGVRPLAIGRMNGGHIVMSESYVIDQFPDAKYVRDVHPGEIAIFRRGQRGFESIQFASPKEAGCIFERIYFSNPRSRYNGVYHEDFRFAQGQKFYEENKELLRSIESPIVVPILDSSKHGTLGLSYAMGTTPTEAFLRIHNPPRANNRSFTSATQEDRIKAAYRKQHLREDLVRGRTVIVVEDTIVRATTLKIINKRLSEAGAAYVINAVISPGIRDICPYGMDFQNKNELAAAYNSVEEIRQKIGADKLIYLSLGGLNDIVKETYGTNMCAGCFGGSYAQHQTLDLHS